MDGQNCPNPDFLLKKMFYTTSHGGVSILKKMIGQSGFVDFLKTLPLPLGLRLL
jgi:hypothetical protein